MTLIKIERVVQAAREILEGTRSGGADVAQELAEIFRQTKIRLEQMTHLMEQKELVQAQFLAEQSPSLTDLVRILGFAKLPQWNSRCAKEGWSPAGVFDRRHLLQLQECFQVPKGSTPPEIANLIRAQILRGDREEAILGLKVFLRQRPTDSWATGELERLLAAEANARILAMREHLDQGSMEKLRQALEAFERLGLEGPPQLLDPISRQVLTYRKNQLEQELLSASGKMEQWKKEGNWAQACEYGDRLRAEASELGIKPTGRGNLTALLQWADTSRKEVENQKRILQAEKDLKAFLDQFEQARDSRIPLKREGVRSGLTQLEQFHRLSEELRHSWTGTLEGQRIRVERVLQSAERGHILRQRVLLVSLVGGALAALGAGGYLVYQKMWENRERETMARMLETCRSNKTMAEIEQYLAGLPVAQPGESAVIREIRARLGAEVERVRGMRRDVEARIETLKGKLAQEPRVWREEAEAFREINQRIQDLMTEDRTAVEEKKSALEKAWLEKAAAERERLATQVATLRKQAGEELKEIQPQHGAAVERLEVLGHRVKETHADLGQKPVEIRPSETLLGQLGELKVQIERKLGVAKELQGLRQAVEEASRSRQEKAYQSALEKLVAQPEIPNEEKALGKEVLAEMQGAARWKRALWWPAVEEDSGESLEVPPAAIQADEVLPRERDLAKEILEVAGLKGSVYLYRLPAKNSRVSTLVYSDGKIEDTTLNPKGELFAVRCRIWNPQQGDFERRYNLFLSSDQNPPYADEEPLLKLFIQSKMKNFCAAFNKTEGKVPRVSAVGVAVKILEDRTAPPQGRIFLLQKLHALCSLRPELHDLRFMPWLRDQLQKLSEEPAMEDNCWLSPQTDPLPSIWTSLVGSLPPKAEEQAGFLQALATEGANNKIIFVGHVPDHGQLSLPEEAGVCYLVPQANNPGGILLTSKKRGGLKPYTPIYRLEKDPAQIWRQAKEKSRIDDAMAERLVRENLPVLSAYLFPNG